MDLKIFQEYINDLCETKKMDKANFIEKLLTCGSPGTTSTTVIFRRA